MYDATFSFKLGLTFTVIYFVIGLIACILIFPFVFTVYGYFLMGAIGSISFILSLVVNIAILASFKNKPTRLKQYWVSLDWSIPIALWIIGVNTSRPLQHYLFFIGFGYVIASLITKVYIAKK